MSALTCIVVTPQEMVLQQTAQRIVVTLEDGELGIAPGHTPLIGRLGPGQLRITSGILASEVTDIYYVEGGFVEVVGNEVTLLTDRALPVGRIDVPAAHQLLDEVEGKLAPTPELMAQRDRAADAARAQLRAARKA